MKRVEFSPYEHHKCTTDKENETQERLSLQLLSKHKIGQSYCKEDAQLIYRHHNACFSILESLVVAEPAGSCAKAGENNKT